ncbi:MAG: AAA family ATPase [Candidatus Thorarchaeota archaeon]|nr:MAG: AAA family ATPase [Candidatus Thorarchaeota archaeon]
MIDELPADTVRKVCDPSLIQCKTTEELSPVDDIIGQERALRALRFGLDIENHGFNIFVAGYPGTGKTTTVRSFLVDVAKSKPAPIDWVYVYNFKKQGEPRAIEMPRGMGVVFKRDLEELLNGARKVLPEAFESEEYILRRQSLVKAVEAQRDKLLAEVNEKAKKKGFVLRPSQSGLLIVPVVEGQPISDQEMAALDPELLEKIADAREELNTELRSAMRELRKLESEVSSKVEALNRDVALFAIGHFVADLRENYSQNEEAVAYIDDVEQTILSNLPVFVQPPQQTQPNAQELVARERFFRNFEVNVIVDNGELEGAPIVVEMNPTYLNLFGQIEKEARFGVLMTDFTMIQPGSLHKANGGYLMIPVEELLKAPLSWESLKRALKNREIVIEEAPQVAGTLATRGLKPEPIPLDVKVILVGDPSIYELLYTRDPDFKELFKVKAHFDITMPRTKENIMKYASAMANVCAREGLKHLDAEAAAKVIEYSVRLADDQEKLSTRFADVADIVREATFYATKEKAKHVSAAHVKKAIEEKVYRSNLIQEKIQEMIKRRVILIDTQGEKVGQVNGLTVMKYGDFTFGGPSRVTVSIGVGRHGIVDIERESNLGGNIHTKGVMILGGYLQGLFAHDKPLSLSARLVFEQSYAGVDGDSASSTELYALLSTLSGLPIKQNFAVTGSVNQRGQVQAIGGVNEKIEGFFEVCRAGGLTGEQGVLIPASNVQNLMLKEDLVEAIREGKFHIYPIERIEEGIEILTGARAGVRQPDGGFEEGSVYDLVDKRLMEMAQKLREFEGAKE